MASAETRRNILDVAEQLFAESGFAGTSLRRVASQAGVQLSLVNYHFGSKQDLYINVIKRRAAYMSEERERLLDAVLSQAVEDPPSLSAVLSAFILPYLRISTTGDPGWRHYARLIAQAANARHDDPLLLTRHFDPTARRFIAALQRALPERSEEEVMWAFNFLMGAMLHTFAQTQRTDGLSDGKFRSDNLERICEHMIPFLEAGFRACTSVGSVANYLGDVTAVTEPMLEGTES